MMHDPDIRSPRTGRTASRSNRSVWRSGAVATVEAAATELLGAIARVCHVPMTVGGAHGIHVQRVVFPAFAFSTCISGVIGTLVAVALARWSTRPRAVFVALTIAITTVSLLLPILIGGATTATRLVLVASHLVAAGIIIPQLALQLPRRGRTLIDLPIPGPMDQAHRGANNRARCRAVDS
jgi:hypothetical protein